MDGISFDTWLEISGPILAVLLCGVTLLRTRQQAIGAPLLELGRTVGRLEGSAVAVDASIKRLGEAVQGLSQRIEPVRAD